METLFDQTKSTGTKVFEPFKLAGITFSNRIIRSATFEGVGDESGKPNEQLIKCDFHVKAIYNRIRFNK